MGKLCMEFDNKGFDTGVTVWNFQVNPTILSFFHIELAACAFKGFITSLNYMYGAKAPYAS